MGSTIAKKQKPGGYFVRYYVFQSKRRAAPSGEPDRRFQHPLKPFRGVKAHISTGDVRRPAAHRVSTIPAFSDFKFPFQLFASAEVGGRIRQAVALGSRMGVVCEPMGVGRDQKFMPASLN